MFSPIISSNASRDKVGAAKAGQHFIAITDPGSSLEKRAKEQNFRHIFHGVPSIGGRYSVLSPFGLVPAAIAGVDIAELVRLARIMMRSCGPDVPPAENPGIRIWHSARRRGGGGPRQGHDHRIAGARQFRRLGRAIVRRIDRKARQGDHSGRRRAARCARGLRQRSRLHRLAAGKRRHRCRARAQARGAARRPAIPSFASCRNRPKISVRNSSASRSQPRSPAR